MFIKVSTAQVTSEPRSSSDELSLHLYTRARAPIRAPKVRAQGANPLQNGGNEQVAASQNSSVYTLNWLTK